MVRSKWLGILLAMLLSFQAYSSPRIIGYYPFWVHPPLTALPIERLTQITYAFAGVSETGQIMPGEPAFDLNKATLLPDGQLLQGNYAVLRALKRTHPGLKTVIAIGGWHDSAHFSKIAADPQLRRAFAQSVMAFTAQYGFDGVEIAWNYPGFGGKVGNSQRVDDGQNLVLLLQEIRAQSRQRVLILGLCLGPLSEQIAALPIADLMPLIDYGVLNAGDYTGTWSPKTGHKSPMYSTTDQSSIKVAVNTLIEKQIDPKKLVLLVPTQGMSFLGVLPQNQGYNQSHHGASFGTWDDPNTAATGMIGQDEAALMLANGDFVANWDASAKAMSYYSPTLQQFISIETPQSMAEKLKFAKEKHLAGMALWDLTSDSSAHSLLRQIEGEYYPERALWHDLLHWWAHHPAWIETLFGVLLATFLFIGLGLFVRQRRERKLADCEVIQSKQMRQLTQALPLALAQLQQTSLAILEHSQQPQLLERAQPMLALTQSLAWQLTPFLELEPDENAPATDLSHPAQRMQALTQFSQRLSEQRSLEKMLEVTMAFLAHEGQVKGVALYQDGDLIAHQGEAVPLGAAVQAASAQSLAVWAGETWDDYALAIEFSQPLSIDDAAFYRSLSQQFATVRAQLYELGRQPQLLSELYEIASRRDKLHFIRADKGYSGIYACDLRAPHYITLRLRAIRMYFDERLLLQVHRSYLVNPKKVLNASKRGRDGWVLNVGDEAIPIARQYLARLRSDFAHWFVE